jgi:hypothetical protein
MMNEEVLNAVRLPARLDAQQAAKLLGFQEHDLAELNRLGYLKPLGRPSLWAQKWYSSAELLQLAADRKWLDKATAAVNAKWRAKNEAAKQKEENGEMAA